MLQKDGQYICVLFIRVFTSVFLLVDLPLFAKQILCFF